MLKIYFTDDTFIKIKIHLYSNPDIFGFYPFYEKIEFSKILDDLNKDIYKIEFWHKREMLDERYFENENMYYVKPINKHNILNFGITRIEVKDDFIFGVLIIYYEDEIFKN